MTGVADAPFLTASWRYLVMLNYEVQAELLEPYVPPGTLLDTWHGRALVSAVGFRFLDTRLRGWLVPGHEDFDEVNLRFYVRRVLRDRDWRRGVAFLKEIVPKRVVAWIAGLCYGEPYVRHRMRHRVELPEDGAAGPIRVEYCWRLRGRWNCLVGVAQGPPAAFAVGSEEEFITEHYWGYSMTRDGGTREYRVTHPPWRVWPLASAGFDGSARQTYGTQFGEVLEGRPRSAFLAEGSGVAVYRPYSLTAEEIAWTHGNAVQ